MKLISVVTPCYNEAENVKALYEAVQKVLASHGGDYDYEHVFIDNASTDRTVEILKELAAVDKRVKLIVNAKNFGVYRSPLHGLFQARGDAIIVLASDFQDPPDLIPQFIRKWEEGYKIVAAVKKSSEEFFIMANIRKAYYRLISFLSETELLRDFTGFGLYERCVIDLIRASGDHYPYFRGMICEMGFPIARVEYNRPTRKRGFSKNTLYDLYVQGMNGIVAHSKMPLRLATFTGFGMAAVSMMIALAYLVYKLLYWQSFELGLAPLVIGLFFFSAVQLVFLGIVGEYIGSIHQRLFQKWLVIEKERVNFDVPPGVPPVLRNAAADDAQPAPSGVAMAADRERSS